MKKLIRIASLLLAVLIISACVSSRYTIVDPPKRPLSDYSVLEIREMTTPLQGEDAQEVAGKFREILLTKIHDRRALHPEDVVFDAVVRETDMTEGVLILDGSLISYEKGSRASRYFIGFGAGKAYCTIQATFTDKSTGEEILTTNFDGELSMGVFGGSVDEATAAVADAFLEYFEEQSDAFFEQP